MDLVVTQVISPKVQNAINKIKAQQAGIAVEYDHVKKHATLSAESLKVLERETKDALGVIRCEIDSATNARDARKKVVEDQGTEDWDFMLDPLNKAIESSRKQLDNILELFSEWDLRSTDTQYSKHELEALPLASTQSGTAPTNLTIQRVIGELAVAEAQGKDVAVQMKMVLEVYNGGRNSAATAITNTIIDDNQRYTQCMRPHWISPSEVAALKDLATVPASVMKQTLRNGMPLKDWGKGGEVDADYLTFDPAAPNATTPARAIYNRHVAASGSIALYEILCKISSTLGCTVTVIPGGVKALARMVFKSVLNYNGDFSKCHDATRATMEVNSIQDVVVVVNALLASQDIVILRTKDRFQQSYDSRPIGGYRDFQALCVFKHNGGWVYGEVQINLAELVKIKGREGGGHEVFKYARSIAAYTESTYTWKGAASIEMCERIENGMLLHIDLDADETLSKDAALFNRFIKALQSTHCRVAFVRLSFNKLKEQDGVALAEALKINTSLTSLDLSDNDLGENVGVAMAKALKINTGLAKLNMWNTKIGEIGGVALAKALEINTSLTELDLTENELGDEVGVAMAEALKINTSLTNLNLSDNDLGDEGGVAMAEALKINTSLTDLDLEDNNMDASTQASIKMAWGNRFGKLTL